MQDEVLLTDSMSWYFKVWSGCHLNSDVGMQWNYWIGLHTKWVFLLLLLLLVWKHEWKWNKVFNGKLLNPLVLRSTKKGSISHGSKASHKPSLLLFSFNTAIITECVVGWFFGAKHFGHFVQLFLFLIDEAIKTTGWEDPHNQKQCFFFMLHL